MLYFWISFVYFSFLGYWYHTNLVRYVRIGSFRIEIAQLLNAMHKLRLLNHGPEATETESIIQASTP